MRFSDNLFIYALRISCQVRIISALRIYSSFTVPASPGGTPASTVMTRLAFSLTGAPPQAIIALDKRSLKLARVQVLWYVTFLSYSSASAAVKLKIYITWLKLTNFFNFSLIKGNLPWSPIGERKSANLANFSSSLGECQIQEQNKAEFSSQEQEELRFSPTNREDSHKLK